MNLEFLVPIGFFWMVVSWKYYGDRHRERMALISQGITPGNIDKMPFMGSNTPSTNGSLKWGIVALFMGLSGLITWFINQTYEVSSIETLATCSMLVSGGAALISFHWINSKTELKKIEQQKLEVIQNALSE